MPKVIGRMMEDLNDLYVEKIRQAELAMSTGKAGTIGNIFAQYEKDRQRIIDVYMGSSVADRNI